MAVKKYEQKLWNIVDMILKESGGRATLEHELDADGSAVGHTIAVDGKNIGETIELYFILGACDIGWEHVLPKFLADNLFPLRRLGLYHSYKIACAMLHEFGREIFAQSEYREDWNELMADAERIADHDDLRDVVREISMDTAQRQSAKAGINTMDDATASRLATSLRRTLKRMRELVTGR